MVDHLKKIDLVIPCAGMGNRLGYLTKKITKNMVKVNGISILEHQLKKFLVHKKKISTVHFILGYKAKILKSFILKLNLPFEIKFHFNKNYKKTNCAISFLSSLNSLKKNIVVLNSDIVFNQKIINNILKTKTNNFVLLRKPKIDKKERSVKALILRNKIINIDILSKNFNYEVVGPFKLSKNSLTILKKFYTQTNFKKLSELSCYSLFGKVLNYIDINYSFIKDEDWYEINTLKEYTQSFNNKIFKI